MAELLRMPEVAANTEEATLASWPVAEGEAYSANDVIASIETAKAAVDVEAEADGVFLKRLVPAGSEVSVGEAIALIGRPGETVTDLAAVLAELGVSSPAEQPAPPPDQPVEPGAQEPEVAAAPRRRFSSPLARRLAREAGIGLEQLSGSGPNGRIVRRDVEQAIAGRTPPVTTPPVTTPPVTTPPVTTPPEASDLVNSKARRLIARRLTESKLTIPHFYLRGSARVGALLELRAELNQALDVRVSLNDLLIKAMAGAHRLVPAANVAWTEAATRRMSQVDIAVAVATETGLSTPVLRGVEAMGIVALAEASRDLVTRARAGQLRQSELEGGTATITNLGMYGTEEFAAIINPPQAMILAVGAVRQEPVVGQAGALEAAALLRVTLSVDHRPIDGATAAEWMRAFIRLLEHPLRIIV